MKRGAKVFLAFALLLSASSCASHHGPYDDYPRQQDGHWRDDTHQLPPHVGRPVMWP